MSSQKAFKIGDRVDYYGKTGVVIKLDVPVANGPIGALVEWEDKDLIPPQMEIPYSQLLFVSSNNTMKVHNNTLPVGNQSMYGVVGGDSDDDLDIWSMAYGEDSSVNTETHCPVCRSEWKETWISHRPVYDCLKCNKKKEDIVKELK